MQQFASRRKRCWKLLKELDPDLEISEQHRADLLLDLSGPSHDQRILIMSSIGNARDYDKIVDALVVQHPRIHVKEQRRGVNTGKFEASREKVKVAETSTEKERAGDPNSKEERKVR